mgnify:CR=1 FL=1|tara:strand:- start:1017 stop:2537 length:1521 start_codon:yes stop_codon:yes gene_type:complete
MKSVLVNFLSDTYLMNFASQLVNRYPDKFAYLFDLKKPNNNDSLSNLNFLDCTFLYDSKFFSKAFKDYSQSSFSYKETKKLEEGLVMVLRSLDRITPEPVSNVENEEYYWELASYFKSFFSSNKNISSIIFDNIPHMPWDLTLFYVSKLLNIKTLILRRTNIGGVAFICEDFRPSMLNYKFNYKDNTINIFKDKISIKDKVAILSNQEFSKSQINGVWPEEYNSRLKINEIIGKNFYHYLSIIYSLVKIPKLQTLGASNQTFLNSTFSRQRELNRYKYFKLRKNYKTKLKTIQKIDEEFTNKLDDISKINYIFFPLHFQPERSTLPEGLNFDKQYLAIRLLSEKIDSNIKIIVKDHPKQYYSDLRNDFYRDENYLKKISKIKNVIVVSRNHNFQSLLINSKITASISGSVTWQGLLKGIPGVTFSDTWLSDCKSILTVHDDSNLKKNIELFLNRKKEEVYKDVVDFIETNQKYLLDTVVYSKHLRFMDFNEELAINNLTKYLVQRI